MWKWRTNRKCKKWKTLLIFFTSYLCFIFAFCQLQIYLALYFLFHCFRNCIYEEFFIHELELEIDCGAVETLFLFLIPCFYNQNKKRPNLICLTHWLSFLSKNSVTPLFLTGDMVEDPTADQPWCILQGIHRIPLLSHTSVQFFLCTKLMSFLHYLLLNSLSKERMRTNSLTLQSPNGRSLCVLSKWLVFNWKFFFCDLKANLVIISTNILFTSIWFEMNGKDTRGYPYPG